MTNLTTEHASLPSARPGWTTIAYSKRGELNDLGTGRRMTLGERLLGGYQKFYQVNLTPQTDSLETKALSATGRYEFPIRIEIDFKVIDAKGLVKVEAAKDKFLLTALRRIVFSEASLVDAEDFKLLEDKLNLRLDPKHKGPSMYEMFEVTAIAADVSPPEGYNPISGDLDDIRNLEAKLAGQLARGNDAAAKATRQALEYMKEQKFARADETSLKLDKLKELVRKRSELEYEGPVDPLLLSTIDEQIEELGGVSQDKIEARNRNAEKKRLSQDEHEDEEDIN